MPHSHSSSFCQFTFSPFITWDTTCGFCLQMAPVLRPKHPLKGRSVVPLVKRLRNGGDITALARLGRYVDPEMSQQDLLAAITKLGGERQPADLWQMAGRGEEPTDDDLRIVLHHSITLAKEFGQPLDSPQPGNQPVPSTSREQQPAASNIKPKAPSDIFVELKRVKLQSVSYASAHVFGGL